MSPKLFRKQFLYQIDFDTLFIFIQLPQVILKQIIKNNHATEVKKQQLKCKENSFKTFYEHCGSWTQLSAILVRICFELTVTPWRVKWIKNITMHVYNAENEPQVLHNYQRNYKTAVFQLKWFISYMFYPRFDSAWQGEIINSSCDMLTTSLIALLFTSMIRLYLVSIKKCLHFSSTETCSVHSTSVGMFSICSIKTVARIA